MNNSFAFILNRLFLPTFVCWFALPISWSPLAKSEEPLPQTIRFNQDVRPILSDACFHCHGPDEAQRQADLRLDLRDGAFPAADKHRIIVAHSSRQSELYRRISATDPELHMPPADSGKKLSPREVAIIRRWIDQGATWQKHWSLIPAERPSVPTVQNHEWTRNEIDPFVLSRLAQEGLSPSPQARQEILLRRVTLDLTGLPSTPGEVSAFLADDSPAAYERVVDRLLSSPRYGERMAILWLDAARYADTNGYQTDGERQMWRWRDWVIEAFNSNMPYDQFTLEQIAGDMLPHATLQQKIATGFNRNHRGNSEGGIIPEEYAVEYVADRVETTCTVWLGITIGCARCHDHKYDPFTQQDYYRLFAFFNNIPEKGRALKFGNSPPWIKSPTRDQQAKLKQLTDELAASEKDFQSLTDEIASSQQQWEKEQKLGESFDWSVTNGLRAHFPLENHASESSHQANVEKFVDGQAAYDSGKIGEAVKFDGKRFLDAGDVGDFGYLDKFSLGAWIFPRNLTGGTIVSRMTDVAQADGYRLVFSQGKLQVNLVKRWLDDAIRVETQQSLKPNCWYHVMMTYDGSRTAQVIKIFIDGRPARIKVLLDELNQSFNTSQPLRIGGGGGPLGRFHGLIDELRVYDLQLSPAEVEIIATEDSIFKILCVATAERNRRQADKLRAYFLRHQAPEKISQAFQHSVRLKMEHAELLDRLPTTMVMQEMQTPRETFILTRGQYNLPGKKVEADVPASLPNLPSHLKNRLGLAHWLVDRNNPLTARVIVNRYWQMFFGNGIVKTVDDFGSQGRWPSHPQLLNWLATELMDSGWNVKQMHRLIVTSASYRQSSQVSLALRKRDPENRLLARGPRMRLSAEMIRDQALAAGGLLVETLGGSSVKPYQPAGLWKEVSGIEYPQDSGAGLYRRGLYTFWKRTAAPPAMMNFDASGRETCTVRQSRTNTPLQALTLMNDVTFVEASRALAQRAMIIGGETPRERIGQTFLFVLGRNPRPAELKILVQGFQYHLDFYRQTPEAAKKLIDVGQSSPDKSLAAEDLAAYTAIAGLILNLDEAVTKE